MENWVLRGEIAHRCALLARFGHLPASTESSNTALTKLSSRPYVLSTLFSAFDEHRIFPPPCEAQPAAVMAESSENSEFHVERSLPATPGNTPTKSDRKAMCVSQAIPVLPQPAHRVVGGTSSFLFVGAKAPVESSRDVSAPSGSSNSGRGTIPTFRNAGQRISYAKSLCDRETPSDLFLEQKSRVLRTMTHTGGHTAAQHGNKRPSSAAALAAVVDLGSSVSSLSIGESSDAGGLLDATTRQAALKGLSLSASEHAHTILYSQASTQILCDLYWAVFLRCLVQSERARVERNREASARSFYGDLVSDTVSSGLVSDRPMRELLEEVFVAACDEQSEAMSEEMFRQLLQKLQVNAPCEKVHDIFRRVGHVVPPTTASHSAIPTTDRAVYQLSKSEFLSWLSLRQIMDTPLAELQESEHRFIRRATENFQLLLSPFALSRTVRDELALPLCLMYAHIVVDCLRRSTTLPNASRQDLMQEPAFLRSLLSDTQRCITTWFLGIAFQSTTTTDSDARQGSPVSARGRSERTHVTPQRHSVPRVFTVGARLSSQYALVEAMREELVATIFHNRGKGQSGLTPSKSTEVQPERHISNQNGNDNDDETTSTVSEEEPLPLRRTSFCEMRSLMDAVQEYSESTVLSRDAQQRMVKNLPPTKPPKRPSFLDTYEQQRRRAAGHAPLVTMPHSPRRPTSGTQSGPHTRQGSLSPRTTTTSSSRVAETEKIAKHEPQRPMSAKERLTTVQTVFAEAHVKYHTTRHRPIADIASATTQRTIAKHARRLHQQLAEVRETGERYLELESLQLCAQYETIRDSVVHQQHLVSAEDFRLRRAQFEALRNAFDVLFHKRQFPHLSEELREKVLSYAVAVGKEVRRLGREDHFDQKR